MRLVEQRANEFAWLEAEVARLRAEVERLQALLWLLLPGAAEITDRGQD